MSRLVAVQLACCGVRQVVCNWKKQRAHLSFSSAGFINWVWNAPATANLTVMRALNSFAIFSTACKRPRQSLASDTKASEPTLLMVCTA